MITTTKTSTHAGSPSGSPSCSLPSSSGISSDCYTCRFADGRFPTINGKIANFETIEKARKEAKRWGAVEIVNCRQLVDGSWVEHGTADVEQQKTEP